jgi:hypothetical protein
LLLALVVEHRVGVAAVVQVDLELLQVWQSQVHLQ